MESIEPKIVAAITGAIARYDEEAERRSIREKKEKVPPLVEPVNLWGIAGRQDLMLQGKLWQLRLCK